MADSRICSIYDCGKPHKTKGLCVAHYTRFLRHGDPLGGNASHGEALAFLENTVLSFSGDECLVWPFSRTGKGYGQIWYDSKMRAVHREVCEREHGAPPTPKHEAAHLCGKGHEGCVNRKHLAWKTRAENEADKLVHGTSNRGERHKLTKLTEAQVFEIREAQETKAAIARRFGVSRTTINRILNRITWAHV